MTKHYAVMGNPIAHSLSPQIHQRFAEQFELCLSYEKILVPLDKFEQFVFEFFEKGGLGLNVTLPFKAQAFNLAHTKTKRAQYALASNTLWQDEQGLIHADNTDGVGLVRDLKQYIDLCGQKILLIGASGAACGVVQSLLDEKPKQLHIANRTVEKAKQIATRYEGVTFSGLTDIDRQFDVIINATSASISNKVPEINPSVIGVNSICYDMVYGKNANYFLNWAKNLGAISCLDGLGMLVEQAAESFFIWHGLMPNTKPVFNELHRTLTI